MTTSHTDPELTAFVTYKQSLERFQDALESIREIADFAAANKESIEPEWKATVTIEAPDIAGVPAERTRSAVAAMGEYIKALVAVGHEFGLTEGSPAVEEARKAAVAELNQKLDQKFTQLSDENFDAASYASQMLSMHAPRRRTGVILSSLLTSAVGDFEVLFSQMVGMYFALRPQALSSRELQFSWEDIRQFDSIEELRSFHADRQVEQLMWKGFDDWMDWLEKKMKIKLSDVALDSDAVAEVFQRRHIIVHNGGRVSRQYLLKAPGVSPKPAIGVKLTVNKGYLEKALDQLFTLGTLLASSVFFKLATGEGVRGQGEIWLTSLTHNMLLNNRWEPALRIANAGSSLFRTDAGRLAMRLNSWAAKKKIHGVNSIKAEVERWDTSALRDDYRMSRLALLDDFDGAWEIAKKLLMAGDMTRQEVEELSILVSDEEELEACLIAEFGDLVERKSTSSDQ
ncbi:hypothetical protein [Streptomyces sp. 1222.5]|uniref:hypothetical protein n=1 Tax=Streptomyces sp. 1222.5 TaxID=1881026 RepID=UPI003D736F7E